MALTKNELQERKNGIFSTDVAPALGLSKYSTPVQVWMEKCGMHDDLPEQEKSEAQEMGLILEPVIASIYSARQDVRVKPLAGVTLWHPKHQFMGSHFDYLRDDSNTLVEIKNFHPARKKEFGEDGSQDVPMDCLVQCVHEAIVWNTRRVDLAVLFGGQQFQIFPLEIDEDTVDMVISREERFWKMVVEKVAPEPVNPDETRRLFPRDNGQAIIADTSVYEAYRQLIEVRQQIKNLGEIKDGLDAFIQNYMGSNSILADHNGTPLATWKAGKPVRRVDTQALKESGLYMQYSKESEASRTFLLKEDKRK